MSESIAAPAAPVRFPRFADLVVRADNMAGATAEAERIAGNWKGSPLTVAWVDEPRGCTWLFLCGDGKASGAHRCELLMHDSHF